MGDEYSFDLLSNGFYKIMVNGEPLEPEHAVAMLQVSHAIKRNLDQIKIFADATAALWQTRYGTGEEGGFEGLPIEDLQKTSDQE